MPLIPHELFPDEIPVEFRDLTPEEVLRSWRTPKRWCSISMGPIHLQYAGLRWWPKNTQLARQLKVDHLLCRTPFTYSWVRGQYSIVAPATTFVRVSKIEWPEVWEKLYEENNSTCEPAPHPAEPEDGCGEAGADREVLQQ